MKNVGIIKFSLIFLIIISMASCQIPSKNVPSENNNIPSNNDTYDINDVFYNYVEKIQLICITKQKWTMVLIIFRK